MPQGVRTWASVKGWGAWHHLPVRPGFLRHLGQVGERPGAGWVRTSLSPAEQGVAGGQVLGALLGTAVPPPGDQRGSTCAPCDSVHLSLFLCVFPLLSLCISLCLSLCLSVSPSVSPALPPHPISRGSLLLRGPSWDQTGEAAPLPLTHGLGTHVRHRCDTKRVLFVRLPEFPLVQSPPQLAGDRGPGLDCRRAPLRPSGVDTQTWAPQLDCFWETGPPPQGAGLSRW